MSDTMQWQSAKDFEPLATEDSTIDEIALKADLDPGFLAAFINAMLAALGKIRENPDQSPVFVHVGTKLEGKDETGHVFGLILMNGEHSFFCQYGTARSAAITRIIRGISQTDIAQA